MVEEREHVWWYNDMRAGAYGQKDEGAGNDDSVMFRQCVRSRRWAAHGLLMPEFNSLNGNPIDYQKLVLRGKIRSLMPSQNQGTNMSGHSRAISSTASTAQTGLLC